MGNSSSLYGDTTTLTLTLKSGHNPKQPNPIFPTNPTTTI